MRYSKKIDFNTNDLESLKISELKRLADYWFRQYLLKKSKRKGVKQLIYCPLTEKYLSENKIHLCHYIDRSIMKLRYSEDNCILASSYSNTFEAQQQKEGYKSLHHYRLEKYFGEKKIKKLLEDSKELIIFAREDYISLINKFRDE